MIDTLLSAFLQVVMQKATDYALKQFEVVWGIQENLKKLERMLSEIQDIVGDVEQREVQEAGVRSWLAALENAAYEADDILNEFKLEAMRRTAGIQIDTRENVRRMFSFLNPASFRLKMGRKLNDIVEKIEEIANERSTFHFKVKRLKTQPRNKPQTHSYVVESDIIGREKGKEDMVKLLLDPNSNHNVEILPIVGMGGMGKTTLVQRISKIWDLQVGEVGILSALRLSYSHLPSHLKQCFVYCATFPKGYVMERGLLIRLWMAEGFIPSDGRQEWEDKGHDIFNELAWRSFFQDIKMVEEVEKHKVQGIFNKASKHIKMTSKMHDLVHDLARFEMGRIASSC